MKYATLIVLSLSIAVRAGSDPMPVYYDYVENGKLMGGKIMIDPDDQVDRAIFGLDKSVTRAVWPMTTIVDNGPSANRIDLVILGDGYTQGDLPGYANHVDSVVTSFFAEDPLAAYEPYFNVHRVDVESNESGVDEPDADPPIFRDTALDMRYNCSGIPRLLCINVGKAIAAADDSAPDVDQILALANSNRYGGAGYPASDLCTLAGGNASAVELALHEFGHSFADLADEYDYGDGATYTGPEPADANVSIYDAATQIGLETKWHLWMGLPNVHTYEGAMYNEFGIYRPTSDSKMRSLNRPFEEVNVEQFLISTYKVLSPIDDATPPSATPLSGCTTFFVDPLEPVGHTLDIQWSVDGLDVVGATGETFAADVATPGTYDVAVTVVDNTDRVRDEVARRNWMTDTRQWQITVLEIPNECIGPCCDSAGGCTVVDEAACIEGGGTYQGDGTTCATVTCELTGACCFADASCLDYQTAEDCPGAGGTYQGDGTTCAGATCETGACCLDDGSCLDDQTVGECFAQPGLYKGAGYQGPGSDCASVECLPDLEPIPGKNRYISFTPDLPGIRRALRVTLVSLPDDFAAFNGMTMWVGPPREICENSGHGARVLPEDCGPAGLLSELTFMTATLLCGPPQGELYLDWSMVGLLHVTGEVVVPNATYEVQTIAEGLDVNDEGNFTDALSLNTVPKWGDVCGPGPGGAACSGPPEGVVDVTSDVLGVLDKFANVNNLQKARADLEPGDDGSNNGPDLKVNVANDVLFCLDAFQGAPYPFSPSDPCNPGLSRGGK